MIKNNMNDTLEILVDSVKAGAKYRSIIPELIRNIAQEELQKRKNIKVAVKATRSRLHQIGGAFLNNKIDYAKWLELFISLPNRQINNPIFMQTCQQMMRLHSSMDERLPVLEQFYSRILNDIAPIHSVLDLACGLNPLAIPWMPLAQDAHYYACDIFEDMIAFLNDFLKLFHINGNVFGCDLSHQIPSQEVHLALLLKTLPCLEKLDKQIGIKLIENTRAEHILVSYPVKSLGGREKGMLDTYKNHFLAIIEGSDWKIQCFEFSTELAFLLSR